MRLPGVRIRTLMAVILGAGVAFATMRAFPALWASFLIVCVMFAVSAAVVLFVMIAASAVIICTDVASKIATAARLGRRPDRREGDSAPPGSG